MARIVFISAWFSFTLIAHAANPTPFPPKGACLIAAYYVTGYNFVGAPKIPPLPAHLNLVEFQAVVTANGGGLYPAVAVGNVYQYLAALTWSDADKAHYKSFEEKKILVARGLLERLGALYKQEFGVLEGQLSNEDTVWLGYEGHYLRYRARDGVFLKGDVGKSVEGISEEDILRDPNARRLYRPVAPPAQN